MAVISVDAGTTMIKAVGYDGAGIESTVVRQETSLQRRSRAGSSRNMARCGTPSYAPSGWWPTS